ncbi:hypothetical protein ANCCAN_00794 [Ancylostoma caninum]|uniref:Uncharacterized protein n=1 Tax=Ancylostoma caninum TaxID=29170 RepID=A0A368HDD1_ANCCA|nr:hypothetical protein ANCCAN_00794 [Ancylostoma caninum]
MSTSSEQSAAENNPMDVVAMEPEEAQDHIEDNMNDPAARIVTAMGEIPTAQEHAAEVPHSQELPARVSRSERWQTQAPEVKLLHKVASILFAVFQRVEDQ